MDTEHVYDRRLSYMSDHQLVSTLVRYDIERDSFTNLWEEWDSVRSESTLDAAYKAYLLYPFSPTKEDFGIMYLAYQCKLKCDMSDKRNRVEQQKANEQCTLFILGDMEKVKQFLQYRQDYEISFDKIRNRYKDLETQIQAFQKKEAASLQLQAEMDSILTEARSKPKQTYCMEVRKLTEDIPYENGEQDVWELFNSVQLNPTLPFCTYQGFYKVREDVKVNDDWKECPPNELKAYILQDDTYQPFYLTPTLLRISSNFKGEKEETPEELLRAIGHAFHLAPLVSKQEHQKQIKAVYNLAFDPIHLPYFLYHIQSDPFLNKFLFVDESRISYSTKKYLYISFYPNHRKPSFRITFNISVLQGRDAERVNETCRLQQKCYIKINFILCPNQTWIDNTILFMSSVLNSYLPNEPLVEKEWIRNKIETIERTEIKFKKPPGKERGLEDKPTEIDVDYVDGKFVVPEMFKNTIYIVNATAEDVVDHHHYNNKDQMPQAMLFPKNIPGETKLYVCDEKKDHGFIDLSDKKGNIPYCYTTNKVQNRNSNIHKYDIAKPKTESSKYMYMKKTPQLLNRNQQGSVMNWISLWNVMYHPDLSYLRLGICQFQTKANVSEDSILWLLESVHKKEVLPNTDESRFMIQRKRNALHKALLASPGDIYTECGTHTIQPYLDQFEKGYVDPLLYSAFLSRVYQTHLFFFGKKGLAKEDDFYPIVPRYTYESTMIQESYPTFTLVFLNQGSDFKNLTHPVCELMVSMPRGTKNIDLTSMPTTHPSFLSWKNTFRDMYGVKERDVPLPLDLIVAMSIDTNGHVAWIHTSDVSLALLEPMHSLAKPVRESAIHLNPTRDWIESNGFTVVQEAYTHLQYTGYLLSKEGYTYFVPKALRTLSNAQRTYDWFEKTSRYLIEYTLYLFSNRLKDKPALTQDEVYQTISTFAEETFVVREDVCNEPFPVSRRFSDPNAYFHDTTITIPSVMIKKKVIYYLLQEYTTHQERLRTYHTERFMRNYYAKVSDFSKQDNTILLHNSTAFHSYVQHQGDTLQKGSTTVVMDSARAYVLFHTFPELVDVTRASRFIMQPVQSVSHAFSVYRQWLSTRVNTGRHIEFPHQIPPYHYHRIVWSNEWTHAVTRTEVVDAPLLSLFEKENGYLIQVMLPF